MHSFKIDQEAGYAIADSKDAGLVVSDLANNNILWSFPKV